MSEAVSGPARFSGEAAGPAGVNVNAVKLGGPGSGSGSVELKVEADKPEEHWENWEGPDPHQTPTSSPTRPPPAAPPSGTQSDNTIHCFRIEALWPFDFFQDQSSLEIKSSPNV